MNTRVFVPHVTSVWKCSEVIRKPQTRFLLYNIFLSRNTYRHNALFLLSHTNIILNMNILDACRCWIFVQISTAFSFLSFFLIDILRYFYVLGKHWGLSIFIHISWMLSFYFILVWVSFVKSLSLLQGGRPLICLYVIINQVKDLKYKYDKRFKRTTKRKPKGKQKHKLNLWID